MDDSTIIYTENTNSAGCQTWRSRSKWAATRRDAIVTSHAAIISKEIGAT